MTIAGLGEAPARPMCAVFAFGYAARNRHLAHAALDRRRAVRDSVLTNILVGAMLSGGRGRSGSRGGWPVSRSPGGGGSSGWGSSGGGDGSSRW